MRRLASLMITIALCSCIELHERPITEDLMDSGTVGELGVTGDVGDVGDAGDAENMGDMGDMGGEPNETDLTPPMPVPLDDCNGRDDDLDGEVDETSFDAPTTLNIQFSPLTDVGAGGSIEITNDAGEHVEGSPFTGTELADRSISVRGNYFQIRLAVVEGGGRVYGYQITQITDQNERVIEDAYPDTPRAEDGLIIPPIDDVQSLIVSDSQGGGVPCGASGVGACRLGTLTCLDGALTCVGEINRIDEVACDCLDNDCDGETDEGAEGAESECTFDQLYQWAADRHCVLRGRHEVSSGIYEFNQLTVAPGAELSVSPSLDDQCGGYPGYSFADNPTNSEYCLIGGGCLTLKANRIHVQGTISANAESEPMLRGDCGGGSGGDLVIISDHLKVDQGALRANGRDGNFVGIPVGGGAAGHIKIYSEELELIGGLIEARGGLFMGSDPNDINNVFERSGAGPGGSGGSGSIVSGVGGGGGAGGPGDAGAGGIEDPTRALEIVGHVTLDPSSSVAPHNGRGEPDGYVVFGGQSATLGEMFLQNQELEQRAHALVIRLKDEEGRALSTAPVTLSLIRDQQTEYTYDLGETDEHGWITVDRVVGLPQEGYQYLLRSESAQARLIFVSYYDGSTECTRTYPLSAEGALIPNFVTCAETVIDCEMGCEPPPAFQVTELPCTETIEDCPTITWVLIEGGTFIMGRDRSRQDESPAHDVTLPSLWMMQHEITVAQYRACVESEVCEAPSCEEANQYCNYAHRRDEYPVNYVTWQQLRAFGGWAGGDLPTESQWEYAARQQGEERIYPWGDDLPSCDHVNASQVQEGISCAAQGTTPVCSFPLGHSPQRLCDLIGNVSELVLDRYVDDYENAPDDGTAWCDNIRCDSSKNRVHRGGSWLSERGDLRSVRRRQSRLEDATNWLGGRLVRPVTP